MYAIRSYYATSSLAEMAGQNPVHPTLRAFVHELRALGYREGENLILERRSLEGKRERYPDVIAELVRLKTDVIVTAGGSLLIARAKALWDRITSYNVCYTKLLRVARP